MITSDLIVRTRQALVVLAVALVGGLPCAAQQRVILKSGYALDAARTERIGDQIRLYSADGGLTQLPWSLVSSVESLPTPLIAAPTESEPISTEPTVNELVAAQSVSNSLHPDLLYSVIAAESNFDPQALSKKGAIGLMQLMPATAADLKVDPYDPADNVKGGAAYLRFLLNKYAGSPNQLVRAIAAYNAGPAAVDRYDGVPPYRETQEYVRRVLTRFVALAESKSD